MPVFTVQCRLIIHRNYCSLHARFQKSYFRTHRKSILGLPRRMVEILEGESLLNDATALLALEFGLGLLVGGRVPTFTAGFLRLCYLTMVGIAVGLVIGAVVHLIEDRLDDGPIEIALSILTPYTAYLAADFIHASGVLAVVTCGLYLTRQSSHFFSATVRLQAWAVWDSLTFILNGLVFVLIGLQLPNVLDNIEATISIPSFCAAWPSVFS